jgi:membrane dipeptidase
MPRGNKMFVLDSHCDTPSQILRLRDLAVDNEYAHIDFPKLKKGEVDGAFFALYVPASMQEDEAYVYAHKMLDAVHHTVEANSDKSAFAFSSDQANDNKKRGLFSVFLGLENASPIGHSIERLHEFHEAGVRYVTLCHSRDNQVCDSCASPVGRWGGLSPFGRELVAEMNSIGMLVDVSHISDSSFYDVLACSTKPVVATHSCCRALADHPRNMTDDMIRELARRGGVIQINFYPVFLDSSFAVQLDESGIFDRGEKIEAAFIADPADHEKRKAWNDVQKELLALKRPSFRLIADHIDHVVSLSGIDHVGLGSDFDGIAVTPDGLEDVSMLPKLFEELRSRGYSEDDIAKIAGGNFLRVLDEVASL